MPFENCLLVTMAAIDPNYLIVALFLVGLGVVVAIQMRHYRRMEKLTREMHGTREIKDELVGIRQTLSAVDLEHLMVMIEDMRDYSRKLQQKLEIPLPHVVEEVREERHVDIYQEVQRRLESKGFINIHVLSDAPDLPTDPESEFRLPLEAYKDGVAFKGYAIIKEGHVLSELLKPAYEAFP